MKINPQPITVTKTMSIDQDPKQKQNDGILNQQGKMPIMKSIKPYTEEQQPITIQDHRARPMIETIPPITITHSIRIYQQQQKHIVYIKSIPHNIITYTDVMNLVYILYRKKEVH